MIGGTSPVREATRMNRVITPVAATSIENSLDSRLWRSAKPPQTNQAGDQRRSDRGDG